MFVTSDKTQEFCPSEDNSEFRSLKSDCGMNGLFSSLLKLVTRVNLAEVVIDFSKKWNKPEVLVSDDWSMN